MTAHKLFRNNGPEALFFVVCWVFVFLVPVFQVTFDYTTGATETFDWVNMAYAYAALIPFLFIFLINKLLFEPKYFFKGKFTAFFVIAILLTVIVTSVFTVVAPDSRMHRHRPHPRVEQFEKHDPEHKAPPPPAEFDRRPLAMKFLRGPFLPMLLMGNMMWAASLGISIIFRNRRKQIEFKELEAEHLKSELEYLRYQINPHFFMNTLNNIHALVDIDSESAKSAIIELSRMMRYLLYESNQATVPMRKELNFAKHYLELMRLRCDESLKLSYQEPEAASSSLETGVPPLLFISFIENAFKHGISHKEQSYIDISIAADEKKIHFHCSNSNFPADNSIQQQGGVGLANVRKRLELIYPGSYTLEIKPTERDFSVDLWLPIA